MYVVYTSNTISVQQLAGIWEQKYEPISNGENQVIHVILKQTDWSKTIHNGQVVRNPRVIKLSDIDHDQIVALEFTGIMEDDAFQMIGYITDADLDAMAKVYKYAMTTYANELVAILSDDINDSIEHNGVYDNISLSKNGGTSNIVFTPTNKTTAKQIAETIRNKSEFVKGMVLSAFPNISTMITFLRKGNTDD